MGGFGGSRGSGREGGHSDVPARSTPWLAVTAATLGLLAVGGVVYQSGADVREAELAMAGLTPAQVARRLFANKDLPDVIPIEVEGVLELRLNHCEYEYAGIARPDRIRKLTGCTVYALLYPMDSAVATEDSQVADLAAQAKEFADVGDIDNKEYADLWDELCETYKELATGPAILVRLDRDKHPLLYQQAEEESLLIVQNQGREMSPATLSIAHRNLCNRLLDARLLIKGTIRVQVVEHDARVAGMIGKDDFTHGVRIVRTVKEVP